MSTYAPFDFSPENFFPPCSMGDSDHAAWADSSAVAGAIWPKKEVTIIWGEQVEAEDFIKVPRALLRLPRYQTQYKLKPRHVLLLLSLASRKFKTKKIRVYWEELAEDLGVNKDTVRKWAYELRDWGLLWIAQHRGRDPDRNRVGHRNERNSFDLSPFVEVVDKAYRLRRKDRERSRGGH